MKQNLFKSIADLRFAIFLLLMIAALSIIGTVIEQDQSIETYKLNYPLTNRVFGFLSWDIILRFGFEYLLFPESCQHKVIIIIKQITGREFYD